MANKVTIYGAHHGTSTNIRALSGGLQQVSMWSTLTNVLRMVNAIILCLATSDGEYLVTEDDELLVITA